MYISVTLMSPLYAVCLHNKTTPQHIILTPLMAQVYPCICYVSESSVCCGVQYDFSLYAWVHLTISIPVIILLFPDIFLLNPGGDTASLVFLCINYTVVTLCNQPLTPFYVYICYHVSESFIILRYVVLFIFQLSYL